MRSYLLPLILRWTLASQTLLFIPTRHGAILKRSQRQVMRGLTHPITVALALMLVAPPFSAFAQRDERGPSRLEEPKTAAQAGGAKTPLRTQTFGGHVYHGQLAWRDGRWHHMRRNSRDGWWWDVGGFWYSEQIEGPPDYVSDVEVAEDATASPATPAPAEPNYAVYYRPGDLTGTRYQTLEECLQVRKQAGSGECIWK